MRYVILSCLLLSACANTTKAEGYAETYLYENFPGHELVNVRCENSDSDGNGRVRCNISHRPEGGEAQVENVECPSGWLWQPRKTTCVGIRL